jgi:hypothetical protein
MPLPELALGARGRGDHFLDLESEVVEALLAEPCGERVHVSIVHRGLAEKDLFRVLF